MATEYITCSACGEELHPVSGGMVLHSCPRTPPSGEWQIPIESDLPARVERLREWIAAKLTDMANHGCIRDERRGLLDVLSILDGDGAGEGER